MKTKHQRVVERIVRKESARLTGALIHYLGASHYSLAEDVSHEAILRALTTWTPSNMPEHPAAWLRRVARNRAIDVLRKQGRDISTDEAGYLLEGTTEDTIHTVEDTDLRLLFLTCNEALNALDQVILSLNVVAGFTASTIAELLLRETAGVAQRLVRLKRKLRQVENLTELGRPQLNTRVSSMVQALYLMFCAGYLPISGNKIVKLEIVEDALALAEALLVQTSRGEVAALCALFAFQSSRNEQRTGSMGLIELEQQDRSKWDQNLIQRGISHLSASRCGNKVSRYHVEAAIAAEHATTSRFADTNWGRIEALYHSLENITGSPIVSVSAALASFYAGHLQACEQKLEQIKQQPALLNYAPFYSTKALLLRKTGRLDEAEVAHHRALELQKNTVLKDYLNRQHANLAT